MLINGPVYLFFLQPFNSLFGQLHGAVCIHNAPCHTDIIHRNPGTASVGAGHFHALIYPCNRLHDDAFHLHRRQLWVIGTYQRGQARNNRSGHACPLLVFIRRTGHGGMDFHPWGEHVDRPAPVVGKGSHELTIVVPLRGAHFDPCRRLALIDAQAIDVVAVGEIRVGIVILAVITSGMDKEYIVLDGKPHGVINNLLIFHECLAKTHVDHFCTVFYRIADRVGHILVTLIPIGHRAEDHNTYIVGHAFDTDIIVAHRADDTRHVGAVVSIRADHIGVAVVPFTAVLVIISHDMPRIEFLIEVVIDLVVKMFHPIFEVG